MYVGHVALALGAKAARPSAPLLPLLVAAQGPDWVEGPLRLLRPGGAELLSHGLLPVGVGAAAMGLVVLATTRDRWTAALCALLWLSHLAADLVTGWKPMAPEGPWLGLALYARPLQDFALEGLMLVAAWAAYARTLPRPARRRPAAWLAPALLLALQAGADLVFVRRYEPWRLPVDPAALLR